MLRINLNCIYILNKSTKEMSIDAFKTAGTSPLQAPPGRTLIWLTVQVMTISGQSGLPTLYLWMHSYGVMMWLHRPTGTVTRCLNLGSYNYLGFAQNSGPCAEAAVEATHQYGAGSCSPRKELGECTCMHEAQWVDKLLIVVFSQEHCPFTKSWSILWQSL